MRKGLSDFDIDERGAEAQALLNHPLIEEAMMYIHNEYVTALSTLPIGCPDAITAQAGLQAIQRIRSYLQGVVNDKKMNDKYHMNHRDKINGRN